jgi:hypothetical protein
MCATPNPTPFNLFSHFAFLFMDIQKLNFPAAFPFLSIFTSGNKVFWARNCIFLLEKQCEWQNVIDTGNVMSSTKANVINRP